MPLSDLLVVDASTVLAGPSVGTFFAELGAKVIKVENPHIPDVTRSWKLPSENTDSEISAYYSSVNYLKEHLLLDLGQENNRDEFLELISKADILISNFKYGAAKKIGIEDAVLRALNPRLINGKISGFGEESDRVAYDLILQAESGFMSMNGTAESGPVKMPVALIDVLAAHHLKEGILLALLERTKTGRGSIVSVSLYDAAVASLVNQASNYLMEGKIPLRIGSLHPNIAPYGEIFETRDKSLVTFAIGSQMHFERLCNYLDLQYLLTDERFRNNHKRVINRTILFDLLQDKIKDLDSGRMISDMLQLHVPIGKIKSLNEVFEEESSKKLIREELINGVPTKRITSLAFKWDT